MKMEALVTGRPSTPLTTPTRSSEPALAAAGEAIPSPGRDEDSCAGRLPGGECDRRLKATMMPTVRHAGNSQVRGRGCLSFMLQRVTSETAWESKKPLPSGSRPRASDKVCRAVSGRPRWSAVASGARHRFGSGSVWRSWIPRAAESAVAAPLCPAPYTDLRTDPCKLRQERHVYSVAVLWLCQAP